MIVVTISGSAAELKKLGSDARIVYLDGKTHLNTYNDGLMETIQWEMYKVARPNFKAKVAAK